MHMEDAHIFPDENPLRGSVFENPSILIESIPKVQLAEFQKLAPKYLRLLYIRTIIFFSILITGSIILLFSTSLLTYSNYFWGIPIFLGLLFAYSTFLVGRRFKHEGYLLRAHDLIHRKGVLWRSQTCIPFNRIQHCTLHQGPIEKRFGLATLHIFTAGGQGSDLSIGGLKRADADRLKVFLLQKMGQDEA